jgi:branched-chain amino acid transport system substrate-binding protein
MEIKVLLFRTFRASLLALAPLVAASVAASAQGTIRIGLLNDQSSSYSEIQGPGSTLAAKMAIEEFGGTLNGNKIELLVADHQTKPDVGSAIARRWFDQDNVDMVIEVGHSAVALAVQALAREKNKIVIYTSVGTNQITQQQCSSTGFAWLYDAQALTSASASALVRQGKNTWFFVAVDYNFGQALLDSSISAVKAAGGTVVGSVRFPQGTTDFASFLLQAQASKAKVIGILAGGSDNIAAMKQVQEFGLVEGGQTVTTPVVFISDIKSMGLPVAAGLTFVTGFYWDRDAETREWSKRFYEKRQAMPTMSQAAVYSGVRSYLKAVEAAGSSDTNAVTAKLKTMKINDMYARNAWVREDQRLMHDFYLVKVKTAAESKAPYDFYDILETIPAESAYAPLSESTCPLVKK